MILYINGDSHSVGAELVHNHKGVLKELDDVTGQYQRLQGSILGKNVHTECIKRSYGQHLANQLGANLVCEAQSGGSNARIIRTTREYLKHTQPDLIIIGWSPFEREEWLHDGVYYQVSGGGTKTVPADLADRYRQWVIDQPRPEIINAKTLALHQEIFQFHQELADAKIPHLFFNTFNSFEFVPNIGGTQLDWGRHFVDPYSESMTYCVWLKTHSYQTVSPGSMHFGPSAHKAWADFLYQNYFKND